MWAGIFGVNGDPAESSFDGTEDCKSPAPDWRMGTGIMNEWRLLFQVFFSQKLSEWMLSVVEWIAGESLNWTLRRNLCGLWCDFGQYFNTKRTLTVRGPTFTDWCCLRAKTLKFLNKTLFAHVAATAGLWCWCAPENEKPLVQVPVLGEPVPGPVLTRIF